MRLYFLRHGIAEDNPDGHLRDFDRKLTPKGMTQLQDAARVMKRLGLRPHIYTSPLVRARQTAEIVAEALGVDIDVQEAVAPQFDAAAAAMLIADLPEDTEVMFVGHEPSFSRTVEALTGARIEMKKGGLARVDVTARDPLQGVLIWLIAPRVFSAV